MASQAARHAPRNASGESDYIHAASVWVSSSSPAQRTYEDRLNEEAMKSRESLPFSVLSFLGAANRHLAQRLRL